GVLQKINTNDRVGGKLEAAITQSFLRGAHLRCWLNRPDCPAVIQQFKTLFDRSFTHRRTSEMESEPPAPFGEQAHHTHEDVNYFLASTHLGNSLVLYSPNGGGPPIAGSIRRIVTDGTGTGFFVRRQAPLPPDSFDPFLRYVHFTAKLYSSRMENVTDEISPEAILSHCARLEYSENRCVIVNLSR
ncbi:hypothetical protein DFH07DRAFT_708721, partial [Mycena maculata]